MSTGRRSGGLIECRLVVWFAPAHLATPRLAFSEASALTASVNPPTHAAERHSIRRRSLETTSVSPYLSTTALHSCGETRAGIYSQVDHAARCHWQSVAHHGLQHHHRHSPPTHSDSLCGRCHFYAAVLGHVHRYHLLFTHTHTHRSLQRQLSTQGTRSTEPAPSYSVTEASCHGTLDTSP